jgi:hypothetical protein
LGYSRRILTGAKALDVYRFPLIILDENAVIAHAEFALKDLARIIDTISRA